MLELQQPKMITQTYVPDFIEVLSDAGWIELKDYNPKGSVLVLDTKFKLGYLKPKQYSDYNYTGVLIEVETDSCTTYFKPSVSVLTNDKPCKAKELKQGDLLNRYNMWSRIDKINQGEWNGRLISLFFGEQLYLPIRFERDYCLLIV